MFKKELEAESPSISFQDLNILNLFLEGNSTPTRLEPTQKIHKKEVLTLEHIQAQGHY